MRWTVEEVARALGVALPAGLDPVARLAGVSIDSRTVGRGELFVAIHGPRHDGHDFVAAALDAGALAAVVAQRSPGRLSAEPVRGKLFAVPDTLGGAARTGARGAARLGPAHRGGHRLGRQDHHERNSGGAAGREVPRPEIRGQSEQRIRAAAARCCGSNPRTRPRWWSWACRIAANCGAWRRLPSRKWAWSRASRRCIWNFSLPWTRLRWPSAN